jgi:hypothetical protein
MRVDFNQKFARPGVPHKHTPNPKPVHEKTLLRQMQRSVPLLSSCSALLLMEIIPLK